MNPASSCNVLYDNSGWAVWPPCSKPAYARPRPNPWPPIDLISCLVSDELTRRGDRLLERRRKQAEFRDPHKTLDNFDFTFNTKMNRSLVFDLATCAFIGKREDALFLRPRRHRQKSSGAGHRSSGHSTGLSRAVPRDSRAAGGTRRGRHRRYAQSSTWNRWPRCRCSSSTISACASCHSPPPRICWRSSCGATSAPALC